MSRLKPVRKIAAAAIAGALSVGGIAAYIAGTGALDWRAMIAAAIAGAAPVAIGYLTPAAALPPGGEEV